VPRRLNTPDGRLRFAPDDDYRDPLAADHPECAGRWLAGFAPVEGTELVVLVQQQYDVAVAPRQLFLQRFAVRVGAVLAGGAILFVFARLLRNRWRESVIAGLRSQNLTVCFSFAVTSALLSGLNTTGSQDRIGTTGIASSH
jgi:hypothetical protein